MPEIKTPAPTRFVIAGGWHLRVPHFSADTEYEGMLTGVLMPMYAHDRTKALEDARSRIDALARNGWLNGAREFVIRAAVDYGRRFPLRVAKDRTLIGFDPAAVAKLYIPHFKGTRTGRPDIKNLLAKMASESIDPNRAA